LGAFFAKANISKNCRRIVNVLSRHHTQTQYTETYIRVGG
jgi:hypothetical protein